MEHSGHASREQYAETKNLVGRLIHDRADPIMAYDPSGTIVYANQEYHELFRDSHPDGTKGHKLVDLEPEKHELILEMIEANLARSPDDPELIIESPTNDSSGQPRWYEWRCVQGFDDDGRVTVVVCISRDVTRQRLAEIWSQRAAERLEESNRDLLEFAQVASHDLQEPLRKVTAFASRLESHLEAELDDKGADYIRRMNNAAGRMQDLINDLLTFARVSTRGTDMVSLPVRPVVDAVLEDLAIAIEESKATITVGHLPELPIDASQIGQLFQNLIGNSIKFRRQGVPPEISIQATHVKVTQFGGEEPKRSWYDITVSDNGIGFDEQYAAKIFAPFQRLHGRNEFEGSGVGLSVCRRIVERHQGTITTSSELGAGTTFTIRLPTEHLAIVPSDMSTGAIEEEALHPDQTLIYGAEDQPDLEQHDQEAA